MTFQNRLSKRYTLLALSQRAHETGVCDWNGKRQFSQPFSPIQISRSRPSEGRRPKGAVRAPPCKLAASDSKSFFPARVYLWGDRPNYRAAEMPRLKNRPGVLYVRHKLRRITFRARVGRFVSDYQCQGT